MTDQTIRRMPDFSNPSHGFHHTVDSALEILSDLGVSPSRIGVHMAGPGWPAGWVVEQSPPAGTPIGPDVAISLSVAGLGFFHSLPVGFWDKGGEAEPGTREILEPLDDPLQKANHWVREGARLFDVQRDNPSACSRWISLFGLNPEDWPMESWYKLALLLPNLHRLAGTERGIQFALQLLLDLPLWEIRKRRAYDYLEDEELTLLGRKASRLGVDCIVGDVLEDLPRLVLVIGPVLLDTYYEFQKEEGRCRLDAVLELCLPCYQKSRISWFVLDPARPPRLGLEKENSRLGINSHLGGAPARYRGLQPVGAG